VQALVDRRMFQFPELLRVAVVEAVVPVAVVPVVERTIRLVVAEWFVVSPHTEVVSVERRILVVVPVELAVSVERHIEDMHWDQLQLQ